MKASLVIMRALFEKAREKFKTEAEKAREACEVEQDSSPMCAASRFGQAPKLLSQLAPLPCILAP